MKKISIIFALLVAVAALGGRVQAQCNGTDCYIVITGQDGYGDGWNGNAITFRQNGTQLGQFTINTGTSYTDTLRLCTDNGAVELSWTTGNYAFETSFTITDSLGGILYSCSDGSTLNDGIFATVTPCPSCPQPGAVHVGSVTASSALVSWTEMGSATQWYYSYGTSPVPGNEWTYSGTQSVALSGLEANTLYYFFVYSYCGDGDSSAVTMHSFRTDCGHQSLPLVEGFENNGSNIPFCWQMMEQTTISQYGYTETFPAVMAGNMGHNSSSALAFYSTTSTSASLATPKMPVSANQVDVTLWVMGEDAIQVGYVTSNAANAAFHLVGTAGPSSSTPGEYGSIYQWQQFHVAFDTVTTTDSIWVVLRRASGVGSDYVYVDDVVIREYVDCPLPTGLTVVDSIQANGEIALSWVDTAGSQWQVIYGPSGFDPEQTGTVVDATGTSVSVSGLDDNVLYDFRVRTVCGTTYGYWTDPVSAKPNVYIVSGLTDTITSCSLNIVDDGGLDGDYTVGIVQTIVLQPSEPGQTIRLRGSVDLGGDSYDPSKIRIFSGSDTTGNLLAAYQNMAVSDIDVTSEVGAMTIWFSGSDYPYALAPGYEFYVSCEDMPDCTTPYGLTVSNIAGSTATVSWQYDTSLGEAGGFSLMVTDVVAESTETIAVDGADRSYQLTDLSERTLYRVELVVDCAGADTVGTVFLTVCDLGGTQQIGTTTATTSYLPAYGVYYSIGQQIYLNSELGGANAIYGFRIYKTTSAVNVRQWDVYLDTTSQTSFPSASGYLPPTPDRLYYSGTLNMGQGWIEINFDSAFVVPEGKNVVLTVYDHSNTYGTGYFRRNSTTEPMSIYGYSYSSLNPLVADPLASAVTYGVQSYRSNIVFLTPCSELVCAPPANLTAVPDTHSIELSWGMSDDASSYKVEYRVSDSAVWHEAAASVSGTSYTVTGLLSATEYVLRVSSNCDDTVVGTTVRAVTLCDRYGLPYSTGFEWFTAPSAEPETERCWYRGSGDNVSTSYATYYPYCLNSSYSSHGGTWSMYFYGYSNSPRLVLPQMDAPVNTLNVEFYAMYDYTYGGTPIIEVGVCTDPADVSTYTVVNTFTLTTSEEEYGLLSLDFDSYTGPDGRIFVRGASSNQTTFYIDDLTVSVIPTCRNLSGVALANVTRNSAEIQISDEYTRTGYTVLWGYTDDVTQAVDSMTVSGPAATLTGLQSSTTYYVWVRGDCGATDHSRYMALAPFSTLCPLVQVTDDIVYFNEFDDNTALECIWQKTLEGHSYWALRSSGDYDSPVNAYSGGRMVSFVANNEASTRLVLPSFDFSQMSGPAELSFYQYIDSYNDYYGSYAASTLSVYYRLGESGDWTLLAHVDSTLTGAWHRFFFELPASQGASVYQLSFVGQAHANPVGVNLENIKVGPITTCRPPMNINVGDITERTAIVRWDADPGATYKVQYRSAGSWAWNARTTVGDSVVISPLDMYTPYEVRVARVCSPYEQSDYSAIVRFTTTLCEDHVAAVNYGSSDVDTVLSNGLIDYDAYYSYTEILIDSVHLAGLSTINAFSFVADSLRGGQQGISCQVYIGPTTQNTISAFQFDSNSYALVYTGTLDFSAVGEQLVLLDTPYDYTGGNLVLAVYSNDPSLGYGETTSLGAHRVATNHLMRGYYTGYSAGFGPSQANLLPPANKWASNVVPDITLYGCNPVCHEPVVRRVTTTSSTITVEWYNENTPVQLQIRDAGGSAWDGAVNVAAGTCSYTFASLPAMSQFDIRLRNDCSVAAIGWSDWVDILAITDTACSVPEDLRVTVLSADTVRFEWNDGPVVSNRWELHVWGDGGDYHFDLTSQPATVAGLPTGYSYHAAIRAYCGSDGHVVGDYSDAVPFDLVCTPVSDVQATAVDGGVRLSWTPGEFNTGWLVSYGYADFELNQQLGYLQVEEPVATIANLTPGYRYGFRVRSLCSVGWNSAWTDEVEVNLLGVDGPEAQGCQFGLAPNPATSHVSIAIGEADIPATASIFSADGRMMLSVEIRESNIDLDISQLAPGAYFVRVQTPNWTGIRKLVVVGER